MQHADNAQQSFSSDGHPSLHNAIPALEALHKAWMSRSSRAKYAPFTDAIEAGLKKIVEFYDKTSVSDIYTFVMRLSSVS